MLGKKLIEEMMIFFFRQKTAYEIRNCDWSSDVCSSDLVCVCVCVFVCVCCQDLQSYK